MSFQAAVDALVPRVRDLVLSVTQNGTRLIGDTDKDHEEVCSWINNVGRDNLVSNAIRHDLESRLMPKTYLVSNYLTAADVALYGALHPLISILKSQQNYSHPVLIRYFDHIQFSPVVRESAASLSPPLEPVVFDLENAPKMERKSEVPKKKEKKQNVEETSRSAPPKSAEKVQLAAAADKVPEKKDKKERKTKEVADGAAKKKATNAGAKVAEPEDAGEPVPSMIDLRVGRIVDVMKHPDADSLYVEQIDMGEETGPRTVVSGLVKYVPIEEMRDRYLVAVCNLKPATMRGIKSFAMVLCATSKDGKEGGIEIIQPPRNSKPGDRVYFEGADYENATPLSQLNPKKKIFETIQPGFITLDTREAAWINPATKSVHRIRTENVANRAKQAHWRKMIRRVQLGRTVCCFSTTASAHGHLSHIGREPIKLPSAVTLNSSPFAISITGPLGTASVPLKPFVQITYPQPGIISVAVQDSGIKEQRQMWGTTRTLIANAITGITEGFTVPLFLVGVGYRAAIEADPRGTADGGGGQRLNLKLGHSHNIYVPIPSHVNASVPSATKIVLSCTDKHKLGLFAAKIREFRKPEPYKGKGVFVGREQIRIKSAKKK